MLGAGKAVRPRPSLSGRGNSRETQNAQKTQKDAETATTFFETWSITKVRGKSVSRAAPTTLVHQGISGDDPEATQAQRSGSLVHPYRENAKTRRDRKWLSAL